GPIASDASVWRYCSPRGTHLALHRHRWLWVPAFARTTPAYVSLGRDHIVHEQPRCFTRKLTLCGFKVLVRSTTRKRRPRQRWNGMSNVDRRGTEPALLELGSAVGKEALPARPAILKNAYIAFVLTFLFLCPS